MAISHHHAAIELIRLLTYARAQWRALLAAAAFVAAALITTHLALGASLTVTTTSDISDGTTTSIANLIANPGADGVISLREAITAANNTAGGPHTINFNIGACGGVCTISPTSALPSITTAIIIDGWSQPGWVSAPLIELNGTSAGATSGLTLSTSGNTVRGLIINRFTQNGVLINSGANNNTLHGNYIGTDNTGLVDQGNTLNGVRVTGSTGNQIGGSGTSQGNVISGNGSSATTDRNGVRLDTGANNNTVEYNTIGLGVDGSTTLNNSRSGISIESSSANTVRNNVISGNTYAGVFLSGATTSATVLTANTVGLNSAGNAIRANGTHGVYIDNAPDTQIGDGTVAGRNVLSGNNDAGVYITGASASGTLIRGNYLGTNSTGTSALKNAIYGVRIVSAGTVQVGSTGADEGNLLSGHDGSGGTGVSISNSSGLVTLHNNKIGTNASGTSAIANRLGLSATNANVMIGGTATNAGNLVSGNNVVGFVSYGIYLADATTATIQGNKIGTNAAGTAALANQTGIYTSMLTTSITIGGTAANAGNVISGNTGDGIYLFGGAGTETVTIQGNWIGLDATGLAALPNSRYAAYSWGAKTVVIGGTTSSARNVFVAATDQVAVNIEPRNGVYADATVQGNYVGTDINGTALSTGYGWGIVLDGINTAQVGGTTTGAGNTVIGATRNGIVVRGTTSRASILRNSTYSNSNLGIDLNYNNTTETNDGTKSEAVVNRGMDHPVMTAAAYDGSTLAVAGYVGSAPDQSTFANARVEFFISDGHSSGYGQGRTYIGHLTTDANGNFSGSFVPAATVVIGDKLTATATDDSSPAVTSEFGPQITVGRHYVTGKVFEDKNYGGGNGRNLATALADGGSVRSSARLELYDSTGAYVGFTTTNASGFYGFALPTTATYTIRTVNSTVTSSRTGYVATLRSVQTFRTDVSSGTVTDVYDYVGGQVPSKIDAGTNSSSSLSALTTATATAQSITTINPSGALISGVDFGFSFNVVVNTTNTGQGSLRQLITNANALSNTGLAINGRAASIDHAVFMISNGTAAAGLRAANNYFSGGVATIALTSALPTIAGNSIIGPLVLDAQTQPGWTSAPIVELNGQSAGAANGLRVSTTLTEIRGFVINRFSQNGIRLDGSTIFSTVQGNYIGTSSTGLVDQGNALNGIYMQGQYTQIGGSSASQRNVISGNGTAPTSADENGIRAVSAFWCTIEGNYIGLGADGTTALGNTNYGIYLDGTEGCTVGGTITGAGNLVSSNGSHGVQIQNTSLGGHAFYGNWIGTTSSGTVARANAGDGISIDGRPGNTIGGTTADHRNVISGNTGNGIGLYNAGATGNVIAGNYIGLSASGSAALPNAQNGVLFSGAPSNTLGGTASGAGNYISGNTGAGVYLNGAGTTGNVLQGNVIGLDSGGTTARANATGLLIDVSTNPINTTVGGTGANSGNHISGNSTYNVRINTGHGVTFYGNNIGATVAGSARPSGAPSAAGVSINTGTNNVIGGLGAGEGNRVAYNVGVGLEITGASATGNAIRGNSMHSNDALGIDLGSSAGVTANDGALSAGQPNLLMDFPVFTNASYDSSVLRVRGYVGSAAGQSAFASALVDIYLSDEDSSGYGEGRTYIGTLTADGSGAFVGQLTTAALAVGNKVTATATDASGNTSEFSANYNVREFRLFRNGSFEDGALGATSSFGDGDYWALPVASTALDYWVVENAALNVMPSTYWNASHGVRSVDLNADAGAGAIAQSFDVDLGTTYSVFVDYSGSAACGPTRKGLRISAAGTTEDVTDYLIGGSGVIPTLPASGRVYDLYYDTALFRFTASTDLVTLKFESLSSGLCGAVIDNVRVQAADPFTNGSFETGTDPGGNTVLTSGSTAVSNWLVGTHSVSYVGSSWTAADGNRSVELDGTGVGSIAQTFDALPEVHYRARFALSADPGGAGARLLNASAGGTTQSFSSSNTSDPLSYSEQAFVFRATDIATTLDFASLSASCCTGAVIDNVRMEEAMPFINSSFEDVRFPLRDSTDLTVDTKLIRGWVTSGTALQHWSNTTFAASVGSYSVHLNGPSGAGTISQTFDVEAGTSYDLLFDAAANPALVANQTLVATVVDGGSTLATRTVTLNPSAVLPAQTRWRTQLISFTPTSSRVTLSFASQTAGSAGLVIDNVRYGTQGTLNTTGQFNAFETSTPANAVTGVIKTKIVNQAFTLDLAALKFDRTGYSNYPMSGIKVELLDATDNSGNLDELTNCRSSWTSVATVTTSFAFTGPDNGRKAQSFTVSSAYRNLRVKLSYPGTGPATTAGCGNDNFAVRPASFSGFTASDNTDSTAGTARVLNNSGAGGVVHRAGRPFTVLAQAVDDGGATVTSYDGSPQLAVASCVLPVGCTAGTLAGSASTTAGTVTGNAFTYSEAGSINVQLEDTAFADADASDSTQEERAIRLASAAVLGRFIPDRYQLSSAATPTLAHATCGAGPSLQGFTFTGQNFGFATAPVVRALPLNAAGTALTNARPGFDASHVTTSFVPVSAPLSLTGSVSISSISAASDALIYYDTTGLSFARDASTPVPTFTPTFTLTVDLSDTSEPGATAPINAQSALTVSSIGFAGGTGNNVHFGRALLRPAYADLRSNLYLPLEVQRYTAMGWQVLTEAGACISASDTTFAYSQATGLLNAGSGNSNCASRITGTVTTAGGRASILLSKPTGGAVPSAMTVSLNLNAASGTSCNGAGVATPATSANLPWLTSPANVASTARVSWGAPRSSYLLLLERYD